MRLTATLSLSLAAALVLALAEGQGIAATKTPPPPPKVKVNVTSAPDGVAVFLDAQGGEALGKTPLKNVQIAKGDHKLFFVLEGYEPAELAIKVAKVGETFTTKLEQLASIELSSATNGSAASATVAIDGVALGKIPFSRYIQPGRHELSITKAKFQPYSQWFEIEAGRTRSEVITLEAIRVAGSLLIAGDVPGADVLVDGTPRGVTPVVVDNLDAGAHAVEIRAKDLPTWTQTVMVKAGERTTVSPTIRPQKAATGSLRVLASVDGAQVVLDGEQIGKAPADAAAVAPGTHILEVMAPKFKAAHQDVVIEAGQRKVVRVELEALPEKAPVGTLRVSSAIPCSVLLDGAPVGASPFEREVPAGEHFVSVQAQGYKTWTSSVKIEDGKRAEVAADLKAIAMLAVKAGVEGALVKLDGSVLGKTPVESGELAAGVHALVVSADGYTEHSETIELKPGETRQIDVRLDPIAPVVKPSEPAVALASWGASTLAPGKVSVDIGAGWPYFLDLRLGVGVADYVDAGVGVRTYFQTFEFVGRLKAAMRVNVLGLGLYGEGGGGLGTDERSAYFVEGGPMGTVFFSDRATFTLRLPIEYFSDKCVGTGLSACVDTQSAARVRLGGILEIAATDRLNVFGLFERVLSGDPRSAYQDVLGLENRDRKLYFKAGITLKL